jgi:hypothetical protein
LVREQVECAPPDGSLHVVAFSEPVQDGTTTTDLASGYGQLFAEHLPGYEEIDVREVQLFGGRPAVLRRYRQVPPEGAPLSQISAYLVEDGIGHVVTATTTTSQFATAEGDLLTLIAQFDIDRSAVVDQVPTRLEPGPPGRGSLSSTPWRGPARKKAGSGSDTVALADLSADELVTLARLEGFVGFPFLDDLDAADAMGEAREAVLRASLRALAARELLVVSSDGASVPREDVAGAVRLASDPPLVVTVEVDGDQRALTGLAIDDERCVEVERLGGGIYTLRSGPAHALLDRLGEIASASSASKTAKGGSATVPALAIDRARALAHTGDSEGASREISDHANLIAALMDAPTFQRVRTVHRVGDVVHAGELVWLQTQSMTAWLLRPVAGEEAGASMVEARAVGRDELYEELLALLP